MSSLPVQLGSFSLAGSGSVIADTTLTLKTFQKLDGTNLSMSDFGDVGYGTIEPNNRDNEEQISFTGVTQNSNGTATLTGVKNVLMGTPFTETSGLAKAHAGSVTFIISNTSGFMNQYPQKDKTETITDVWTYSTLPLLTADPTTSNQATRKSWVDGNFCALTGNQTIAGVKTFSSLPTIPVLPVADTDASSKKYVDDTAIAGAPDASTTVKGIVEEATQAEIDADTAVGATGARLYVNPATLALSKYAIGSTPTVQKYEGTETTMGSTTTQFDITRPGGNTSRYTWDGTGTDPAISAVTLPVGTPVVIASTAFSTVNNLGTFLVTGSGANYFEVSNASGSAVTNQLLTGGFLKRNDLLTWTKPANLSYISVEEVGAGGGGGSTTNNNEGAGGGGGGEYATKIIQASSLGATETVTVGIGGTGIVVGGEAGRAGLATSFGSLVTAAGGSGGTGGATTSSGGAGGTGGTGGDVKIPGGKGGTGSLISSTDDITVGGSGGDSILGSGAVSNMSVPASPTSGTDGQSYGGGGSGASSASSTANIVGGNGKSGVVIVTEYYN